MNNCTHFNNYNLRVERAKQLNLCQLYSAAGNATQQCFGKQNNLKYGCIRCKSKAHISAFCPIKFKIVENIVNNVCISLSSRTCNQIILPTLTIEIFSGNKLKRVRALLDAASQRSYVSSNLIKDLFYNFNSLNAEKYDVQTFIGSDYKHFKQVCLGLRFDQGNNYTLPFLVDNNLKLQYNY